MKAEMKGYSHRTIDSLVACAILYACGTLVACQPARQIKSVVRSDLFSIDYGLSENQMDISAGTDDSVDMVMREGIFHILDGTDKKVMKMSSYGDLLALLYDSSRSSEPRIAKPAETLENEPTADPAASPAAPVATQAAAQGRYAAPITFTAPSKVAVDSAQTVYVADRMLNPQARIFDPQSASYNDRIVRRFGTQGLESPYIGQEGPGGSPFPYITAIEVLENDTLVVVSASESAVLVHHFGKAGNLLSTLRLSRASLPLPDSLQASVDVNKGMRIHANLDGMQEFLSGESLEIALKIDYYREYFDPESLVISRVEYAGSWIFTLDGMNGRSLRSLAIAPGQADAAIPELVGESSGLFYILSEIETGGIEQEERNAGTGRSRMLQLLDSAGKVHARYRIDLPDGVEEVIAMKVSSAGQIYALLKSMENIRVAWWSYR